jgi:hypothetical protein
MRRRSGPDCSKGLCVLRFVLIPRYKEARLIDTRASLYIDNHDRARLIQFLHTVSTVKIVQREYKVKPSVRLDAKTCLQTWKKTPPLIINVMIAKHRAITQRKLWLSSNQSNSASNHSPQGTHVTPSACKLPHGYVADRTGSLAWSARQGTHLS